MIGRTETAALTIEDPRISEAHALVSLRHGDLFLLSLRRMVLVRKKPVAEVRLEPGLLIEFCEDIALRVLELAKPAMLLALTHPQLGVRPLGEIASLFAGPPPRIVGRFVADADLHVWSAGEGKWMARAKHRTWHVKAGETLSLGDTALQLVMAPLTAQSAAATVREGNDGTPLRLVTFYDSVEIHRADQPVLLLAGVNARIISELASLAGPIGWEHLAREIWTEGVALAELRHRLDVALSRLRAKLRQGGVRRDLVSTDGTGQVQLILYEGDQVLEKG